MTEPLIINLCPTGIVPTRRSSRSVPLSAAEIVDDVGRCAELGVSMVHLHARDDDGEPTSDPEVFAPVIEQLRSDHPDLVIGVTCSGRVASNPESRAAVLDLDGTAKPDYASLTLGSMNFARDASVNTPDTIKFLAERMRSRGIRPELEAFEPGMISYAAYLAERDLIDVPAYVNILLGNVATSPVSAASLAAFLAALPDGWHWAAAGIGDHQLRANTLALSLGGHVRVGVEDSLWYDRGRTIEASNPELVARVVRIAAELERTPATPHEARQLLGR